jgi:hypothetical protein
LDAIDDPSLSCQQKASSIATKLQVSLFLIGSLVGNLLTLTTDLSYLTIKFPEDDVLTMWKHLEGEYPYMVAIARDILSIPGAGVGVERVFSIARH